ncbi:hypothetical protein AAIH52_33135, partial [Pseudomonas aeruginosa]
MENKSARAKVQAFGGCLTAMVIPNIGAFIAWGFITALFIPTAWPNVEHPEFFVEHDELIPELRI